MAETTIPQPDAFRAFIVLFRYAEYQAKKTLVEAPLEFDSATMIDALRRLYNTYPDRQSQYWTAPMVLKGLEQILNQTGQENLLGNLVVNENLQIVGMLLDAILSDVAISSGTAPYFWRLQFPLLIAVFTDTDLLEAQSHPAREFLNQLAYLSLAANVQGNLDNPELIESLEQAFAIITIETASNVDVFLGALEALSKVTKPLVKSFTMRLDRVVETCRGGHKLDQARLMVGREIGSRIGGKSVPKIILDLLAGGWQDLLVLTCLRQGTDDKNWKLELNMIDRLLELIGKTASVPRLSQPHAREFKQTLLERLDSISAEPSTAIRLAEDIEKLLLDNSGKITPEYVSVPAPDTDQLERETMMRTRLEGFKIGDWIKFATSHTLWTPLRLTWVGHDPQRYVFVNQKGIKTLDLDAEHFIKILDNKRAKRIESLEGFSIVERAAKSLLYTLRERMR